MMKADFLVIGSGIAGLTFALKAAQHFPDKTIIIATKSEAIESNTRYAQGGIATVWNNRIDNFQKHIDDTMTAGAFLSDPKIVEMVVQEAPDRLKEIIQWGIDFDKDANGNYDLALEGGHSEKRILHHKDATGFEIEKNLLEKIYASKNILLLTHYFSVDLIIEEKNNSEKKCIGAHLIHLTTLCSVTIHAKITMLATGGIGQVYANTTNPPIATGDGIAMAYRAGAVLQDMEFIQFHPTALYHPGDNPSFLISEAVRGLGAVLKNSSGEEFMQKYSDKKSLASRDVVSRAIALELLESKDKCVYLDCTMIEEKKFISHFPTIYKKCIEIGINISNQMIPVIPAVHYSCGGIKTDEWGKTNLENLYACGECACTGLHGANRLASNSLLEALVFAHRSFISVQDKIDSIEFELKTTTTLKNIFLSNTDQTADIKKRIKEISTLNLNIIRDKASLLKALSLLKNISKEVTELKREVFTWQFIEVNNLLTVSILITQASINRTENKGLFYSRDNEISARHSTLISSW